MIKWILLLSGALLAQTRILRQADSLLNAGAYPLAVATYAQALAEVTEDSLRLRAYLGAAQAALEAAEDSLALRYAA